jgi:hypothetical protein
MTDKLSRELSEILQGPIDLPNAEMQSIKGACL